MPLSVQEFAEIDLRLRQYEFADSRDRTMVLSVLNEYRAHTKLLKPDDKRLSFYSRDDKPAGEQDGEPVRTIAWRSG